MDFNVCCFLTITESDNDSMRILKIIGSVIAAFCILGVLMTFKTPVEKFGTLRTQSGQYLELFSKSQKPVLFVYLNASQKQGVLPWLEYWEKKQTFSTIVLVSYDGKNGLADLEKYPNRVVLNKFDSSPYHFYPIEQPPASYILASDWTVQGPLYRYDRVIASVNALA